MPNSSGNLKYSTTINLSKYKADFNRSTNQQPRPQQQTLNRDNVELYQLSDNQIVKPKQIKLHPIKKEPKQLNELDEENDDDNLVVLDPKLRQIIKNLVKKCNDEYRTQQTIDKDLITQVEYKDYSLFLSRNGFNPFDNYPFTSPANKLQTISYESDVLNNQRLVQNPPPPRALSIARATNDKSKMVFSTPYTAAPPPNSYLSSSNNDYDFQDDQGNLYFINEIKNLDSNYVYNSSTKSYDFSKNVVRAVQSNLKKNPLEPGGERLYKLSFDKERSTNKNMVCIFF
jgi:hypothetical protein